MARRKPWLPTRRTPGLSADFYARGLLHRSQWARKLRLAVSPRTERLLARGRIDEAIRSEVRSRIGGDTQRIHDIDSRYDAITFKHLLLPVWSLGYRYRTKPHQLVINAVTGEVQGTRPYSFWKIFFATSMSPFALRIRPRYR